MCTGVTLFGKIRNHKKKERKKESKQRNKERKRNILLNIPYVTLIIYYGT